ncbi:MAG: 4-hydroxy-tetrahydrodipicolinate reductase [Candidatus Diapherotrites archaeon]|uniref:4-hydroxy-tetrahydrodipicolinate reductase n=1 Tax=Candidatus Iainarchaeum sp. TaxID=3101447 RepID=A0A938YXB5_9ARCH|nr:4-hydroxy-tetrahydrodipicolinate reductase [Candidatus Diapherotrites archaeon]
MRIALIGYGNMGKEIAALAGEQGIEIAAIIDAEAAGATGREISKEALANADVCIEFSNPGSAVENIKGMAALHKNIVVGTTGWYSKLDEVKKAVEREGIGLVYASNFSLGVNAFFRIVERAAEVMDKLPEYDVSGLEIHHKGKKDSPSGTARAIEKILLERIARKKRAVEGKLDRKIEGDELHFASLRTGNVPGTHSVLFDSIADSIELTHTARNRQGFALGALQAAKWVKGKKGFYSIDDMMKELFE